MRVYSLLSSFIVTPFILYIISQNGPKLILLLPILYQKYYNNNNIIFIAYRQYYDIIIIYIIIIAGWYVPNSGDNWGLTRNTNLALTEITMVPTVTFSLISEGPYTLRSHRGGLLFRSTTSNSISTSAYDGGAPQSEALTRRRYFSCYIHNIKAPEVKL